MMNLLNKQQLSFPTSGRQLQKLFMISCFLLMLILSACSQSTLEVARSTPTPNPPMPTPAPPTMTATLAPQATVTLPRLPTATAEPSPIACPLDYFFRPAPPSCPAEEPQTSFAAEQPFEGGVMIWFEATDSIYVFFKDQRWQRFDDTWSELLPANDPTIIAPVERFQPIRGFGKVWREHQDVREQLGWALGPELAFDSMTQQSLMVDEANVLFLATFNGQVFALTNDNEDDGVWVIAAS